MPGAQKPASYASQDLKTGLGGMFSRETTNLLSTTSQPSKSETWLLQRAASQMSNSIIGACVVTYLGLTALHCGLFSFQYALYTLAAAVVVLVGEAPFLLAIPPFSAMINHDVFATYLVPRNKALVYGATAAGGVLWFWFYSWSIVLLSAHLVLGLFALRYHHQSEGDEASRAGSMSII
eukprot:gnl/TRDRNA2_/TRDRNA2_196561_c0_seq1.p1 gnl/TRDRNA2_/TRDRNA2_196561_c0~~gnl/TRDRNA2_/TRDRNA2_196561_c0_seq1.p1  ORF type:complete len:190 (+),score=24.10 gnl/TRDRNA2_/TRDRNA2_196561_c0_seq1:36-572(+)